MSSASTLCDGLEIRRLAAMEGTYPFSFGKHVWVTLDGFVYCNKFILLKWWHHHSLQCCKVEFKLLCNTVLLLVMFMFISLSTVFAFTVSISWLALFFVSLWGFTISVYFICMKLLLCCWPLEPCCEGQWNSRHLHWDNVVICMDYWYYMDRV